MLLVFCSVIHAVIPEKVLICGVGRDIEKAVPNTTASIEKLGREFLDYTAIIYENNSKDETRSLLQAWAERNSRVVFISEELSRKVLAQQLQMKKVTRTEAIARARNIVLDKAMQPQYDDYKYVIWADLDFLTPWDIDNIVETILNPEQEWDAVLGNGAYDLFALRTPMFPIGFELVGKLYWDRLDEIREKFHLDSNGSWVPVYSAFGGLGIYKREAIQGCSYSGVVTKDLEQSVKSWLADASQEVCFFQDYENLKKETPVIDLKEPFLVRRKKYPDQLGIRLKNGLGVGEIIWFSCTRRDRLPSTCEHIPFHASMAQKGHEKIFINPRLRSG